MYVSPGTHFTSMWIHNWNLTKNNSCCFDLKQMTKSDHNFARHDSLVVVTCKIVTWLHHWNPNQTKENFYEISIMSSYSLCKMGPRPQCINTFRPTKNGRYLPDDIFKCISLKEDVWISIKISLKFVREVPIDNIPVLVQIMAWRQSGDKSLSESMMA